MSGTFSDGSGSSDYEDSTYCSWWILPGGSENFASSYDIEVTFDFLQTEEGYDTVTLLSGCENPEFCSNLVADLSGQRSGETYRATGSMFIRFSSDSSVGGPGFSASYSATATGGGGGGTSTGSLSSLHRPTLHP
eukprot:2967416-Rhodomonas_salina.1